MRLKHNKRFEYSDISKFIWKKILFLIPNKPKTSLLLKKPKSYLISAMSFCVSICEYLAICTCPRIRHGGMAIKVSTEINNILSNSFIYILFV